MVATAGVRAAEDREALFSAVTAATGLPVRLLSEDEEGRLAFRGATHGLSDDPQATIGVIDVGGGSTELVAGTRGGGVTWIASLAIGSAVLTEQYLHSDPPGPVEQAAAADHADEVFAGVHAPPRVGCLRRRGQRDLALPARRRGARRRLADPRARAGHERAERVAGALATSSIRAVRGCCPPGSCCSSARYGRWAFPRGSPPAVYARA